MYAVSLGEGQLKMTPSNPSDGHNGIYPEKLDNGTTAIHFAFTSMPEFLYTLMDSIQNHEVVDETGLKGKYDFTLIVPSRVLEGNADSGDASAAFFRAVRSIGLQVRRKKASSNVIVIDRLEKPTAN